MPTLRAVPGTYFYVNSRRYDATAAGEVHVDPAHRDDVVPLLNAGCTATAPWFEPVPPAPPKPAPPRPTVRLKAPRPHAAFAPASGSPVRYTADADGFIVADVAHAEALVKAGCARA
jgi:hypothetical protein